MKQQIQTIGFSNGLVKCYQECDGECTQCGHFNWGITREGDCVCGNCGRCCPNFLDFGEESLPFHKQSAESYGSSFKKPNSGYSWGPNFSISRGRYKSIFHYNERIAQWLMVDPPIPEDAWERIEQEAYSGKYGAPSDFTRASIQRLLKRIKLHKYCERWKGLLKKFGSEAYDQQGPHSTTIEWLSHTFQMLVAVFKVFREKYPSKPSQSLRHNMLNFNYVHRKMLEAANIYCYHRDFPIPKTPSKIMALDDTMEYIMKKQLGMPFRRSVIIKRPKLNFSKAMTRRHHKHKCSTLVKFGKETGVMSTSLPHLLQ